MKLVLLNVSLLSTAFKDIDVVSVQSCISVLLFSSPLCTSWFSQQCTISGSTKCYNVLLA